MKSEDSEQLIHSARRSGAWLLLGRLGQSGLRLVGNVILAHLLFPEAFGLMGMVSIFLLGLALFSDTGVGPSIVRSPRGEEPAFLATAWTVQVLRGGFLGILCWLLAVPFARLYEEPELARLLPLAGFIALINGLISTNWYLADRRLAQGRKTLILILSQACGILAMVGWAWVDRSVDALLAGNIVISLVIAVLSHLWLPGPRAYFHIDRDAMRELTGFGRWILLSTALTFLAMQGDRLFLGYALLLGPLGIYFMANSLVGLVTNLHQQFSASVVYPSLVVSAHADAAEHVSRVRRSRLALNAVGMAGFVVLACLAPAFFRYLYDDRYQQAAIMVQLLCLPAWFQILKASAGSAVMVYGDSRALAAANLLLLLVRIPACVGGYYFAGIPGIIIGAAIGDCVGLLPIHLSLTGHGCSMYRQDIKSSIQMLLLVGAGILLPLLATNQDLIPLLLVEVLTALTLGLIALAPAKTFLARLRR